MNKNLPGYLFLIVVITFLILFRIIAYLGHYGADDLGYAKLAHDLLTNKIEFQDHASYRWTLIALTALMYKLFGINDFSSTFFSLFFTAFTLFLIFVFLKKYNSPVILIGLCVCVFNPWILNYSTKLMPDMYVAFFFTLLIFILWFYRYKVKGKNPILFAFLFSLTLLLLLATKTIVFLLAPLFIYYVIVDFYKRRYIRFWSYSVGISFFLITGYLVLVYYATGSLSGMFTSPFQSRFANACDYQFYFLEFFLKQNFFQYFTGIIREYFAGGIIFILAAISVKKIKEGLTADHEESFLKNSTVILFFSCGLIFLLPLNLFFENTDMRHFLFLLPLVSVSSAPLIHEYLSNKKYQPAVIILVASVTLAAFILDSESFYLFYIPLSGIVLIRFLIKQTGKKTYIPFLCFFILILMNKPFKLISDIRHIQYGLQREIISSLASYSKKPSLLITDNVAKCLWQYYNSFKDNQSFKVVTFDEFNDSLLSDSTETVLFLNWYTCYLCRINLDELPFYTRVLDGNAELLFENKNTNSKLFKLKHFKKPDLLYQTMHTFENTLEPDTWLINSSGISDTIKFDGSNSYRLEEFSPTFRINIDSLFNHYTHLIIDVNFYFYPYTDTDAELAFSLEKNKNSYYWKSYKLKKFFFAHCSWWPVKSEIVISKQDVRENSSLLIFLWQVKTSHVYLDNFSVKIQGLNKPQSMVIH